MTVLDAGPPLTDRDLARIARLVYRQSGISLHAGKRALVTARLQKRVKQLGLRTFREYLRHIEADASGAELTTLLDAIATNHTGFFREPQHFTFLRDTVLPPLARGQQRILGWSAACATGEEPYTIAMLVMQALGDDAPLRARVVATDLSTKALAAAEAAIYKSDRVQAVPSDLMRQSFERGVGARSGFMRVAARVRRLVEFRRVNLLDIGAQGPAFDFIFCRNVMIYFDAAAQQQVVTALERRLIVGGYLFVSHSESLNGVRHALKWVAPAVYQRVSR